MCLYKAQISGERLQDHWSSGLNNNVLLNNWVINRMLTCHTLGSLFPVGESGTYVLSVCAQSIYDSHTLARKLIPKTAHFEFSYFVPFSLY